MQASSRWPRHLDQIIDEAATWCLPLLNPDRLATCWRSERLRPKHFEPSRAALVASLVRDRRNRLGSDPLLSGALGRLLAYFPDAELSDGAAEQESAGFFDVYCEPPWDCWLAWGVDKSIKDESYRAFLVCWIPEALYGMADRAIYVNPEECIQWLDLLSGTYSEALAAG